MSDHQKAKPRGTREQLERVAPYLYRHQVNGTYYGIKKAGKKIKSKCFETVDRRTADGKLLEWLKELGDCDFAATDLKLDGLLSRFRQVRAGKGKGTKVAEKSLIRVFRETFPRPMDTLVSRVRHGDLVQWLGNLPKKMRHSTWNRYRLFVAQLFALAVTEHVIAKNPFDEGKIAVKKKQHVKRPVPTPEEFQAIIHNIRNNLPNADREDSANFAEFLGLAGVGQAEASALEWENIGEKTIRLTRTKTRRDFEIPIYLWLRPLIERLRAKAGPHPTGRVFKVKDVKHALAGALERLHLGHFSQRSLRAMLIKRLWEGDVDVKLIAKWQGHSDGGKLILSTYTEVFGSNDAAYEAAELAKVEGKVVQFRNAA